MYYYIREAKGQFKSKAKCARPPHHRFSKKTNERCLTYVGTAKKREPSVHFFGESAARLGLFGINLPLRAYCLNIYVVSSAMPVRVPTSSKFSSTYTDYL